MTGSKSVIFRFAEVEAALVLRDTGSDDIYALTLEKD